MPGGGSQGLTTGGWINKTFFVFTRNVLPEWQ
jgi:hypothetical protein